MVRRVQSDQPERLRGTERKLRRLFGDAVLAFSVDPARDNLERYREQGASGIAACSTSAGAQSRDPSRRNSRATRGNIDVTLTIGGRTAERHAA